jgi:isoleucyl-tRNA synthetase
VLDRWILSRLDGAAASMRADLADYQITRAARTLAAFVQDDLSNWYVRRSRRRFWKGEAGPDKEAAYATLHEVLAVTARLLAPFAPFFAETLHRTLVVPHDSGAPESVHLALYPRPGTERRDAALEASMARAMAVTELGRAARSQAGIKVRMPLRELTVIGGAALPDAVREIVRDELNVKDVVVRGEEAVMAHRLKPSFKALGPRFGADVNAVATAIKALPPEAVREGMAGREWTVRPEGKGPVTVAPPEVDLEAFPAPDVVVVADGDLRVALHVRLDPDLEREGRIRELVHRLQNLRKERGLDVTDRVRLRLGVAGALAGAVREHEAFIRGEVLAAALETGSPRAGDEDWDVDGERVTVALAKDAG